MLPAGMNDSIWGFIFAYSRGWGSPCLLKSVSVGCYLPTLLESHCEGAILALFIFIPLLEVGLHGDDWQSAAALLEGQAVFLGPVLWEEEAQRCGRAHLSPSAWLVCLPFCLYNANTPTCLIIQQAGANAGIFCLLLLH